MTRLLAILVLTATGCSSAPLADMMDWWKPGQLPPGPFHGGVCGNPAPASPPVTAFAAPPDGDIVAEAPAPVGAVNSAPVTSIEAAPRTPAGVGWRRP